MLFRRFFWIIGVIYFVQVQAQEELKQGKIQTNLRNLEKHFALFRRK